MSNLVPLNTTGNLPAHLQAFASEGNEFGFSGPSFPTISLKGKVFTIVANKERTLVTKPGTDGEPAPALEVVILNSGPKQGYAKTFYAEGYKEGSSEKPTCFSDDGVAPSNSSTEKQANKCALCPQAAAGSGATNQNPKAKACKSSKFLAVAPAGKLSEVMRIRVPGESTIALGKYGELLASKRIKSAAVVTRIGFDYSVSHASLTFKDMGGITPEMAPEVISLMNSNLVRQIVGEQPLAEDAPEAPALPVAVAAPFAAPVAAPAPAPVAAPDPAPVAATRSADAFSAPAAAPAPAPAAPTEAKKPKAAKAPAAPTQAIVAAPDESLSAALAGINFDDE